MTKTFADKLREWTLYEDAHPSNLRGVIREAAEEIERLIKENEQLRGALEPALRYILHVGANQTERGLPHPQALLIQQIEEALTHD